MLTGLLIVIIVGGVARLFFNRVTLFVFLETWIILFIHSLMNIHPQGDQLGVIYFFILSMKNVGVLMVLNLINKNYSILKFGYILAGLCQLAVFLSYEFLDYYQVFLPIYYMYSLNIIIISSIQIIGLIGGSINDRNIDEYRGGYRLWNKYLFPDRSFAASFIGAKRL